MPLSHECSRRAVHHRSIECHGYLREDDLWDIEAHLIDRKKHGLHTAERGTIAAGEAVHDMWLRLTLDDTLLVLAVSAKTVTGPFSICPEVNNHYKKLVGKRIGPGWNRMVKREVGGVHGCTHLTELLAVIATTAIQTIYPYRRMRPDQSEENRATLHPSLADSCHGFSRSGSVIQRFWPEEARAPDTDET